MDGNREHELFFNTSIKKDIELHMDYQSDFEFQNGIISLDLKYQKVNYGFKDSVGEKYLDKDKKLLLQYSMDKYSHIKLGWDSGNKRNYKFFSKNLLSFTLTDSDIIENTETVLIDGIKLIKNNDYFIDYTNGILTLKKAYPYNSEIEILYSYHTKDITEKDFYSLEHKSKNLFFIANKYENKIILNSNNTKIESSYFENNEMFSILRQDFKNNKSKLNLNIFDWDEYKKVSNFKYEVPFVDFQFKKINIKKYKEKETATYNLSKNSVLSYINKDRLDYFNFLIQERLNRAYIDSDINFSKKDDLNGNISFSERKDKIYYHFQNEYLAGKKISYDQKLYYYSNIFIFRFIKTDKNNYFGFSKQFKDFNIFTDFPEKGESNKGIRFYKNNINIIVEHKDIITSSINIKKHNLLFTYKRNTDSTEYSRFTYNNNYLKFDFEKDKNSDSILSLKILNFDDYSLIKYNIDKKTGEFSYNLIIN